MDDAVAVFILDPKNKTIKDLTVKQKQFRFKCKRCATLCCKLGGPPLTKKDIQLLENAGYCAEKILEPTNSNTQAPLYRQNVLKTREDGSCIFLQQDTEQNCFKCKIYDVRPALCRLYPFSFEKVSSNQVALKVIPCCRGLNNQDGKILDEEFISMNLLEPLLQAMKLLKKA